MMNLGTHELTRTSSDCDAPGSDVALATQIGIQSTTLHEGTRADDDVVSISKQTGLER